MTNRDQLADMGHDLSAVYQLHRFAEFAPGGGPRPDHLFFPDHDVVGGDLHARVDVSQGHHLAPVPASGHGLQNGFPRADQVGDDIKPPHLFRHSSNFSRFCVDDPVGADRSGHFELLIVPARAGDMGAQQFADADPLHSQPADPDNGHFRPAVTPPTVLSPRYMQTTASGTIAACSKGIWSDIFSRFVAGTFTYSAMPPLRSNPMRTRWEHRFVSPRRQKSHRPQEASTQTITRSPGGKILNPRSRFDHDPGKFMPGDEGQLDRGDFPLGNVNIRRTKAAGFHLDGHLLRDRVRNLHFSNLQRLMVNFKNRCFHA